MDDTKQPSNQDIKPLISYRDLLNFAEWPMAVLSDRVPEGLKTLKYEDAIIDKKTGKEICRDLIVTGSDYYGLPTQLDEDVIVALIQISKNYNNFSSPEIEFTSGELISILGWPASGQSHKRIALSLDRWVGVTLYYNRSWWDHGPGKFKSDKFHIFNNVSMVDSRGRRPMSLKGQGKHKFSSLIWNEIVFKSMQDGYVRKFDAPTYFSLKSAVSKRMFRFLGKRMYRRHYQEFDLHLLAWEKIGLGRKYQTGRLKNLLAISIAELEGIGFLKPMPPRDRFRREPNGRWTVIFDNQSHAAVDDEDEPQKSLPAPEIEKPRAQEELTGLLKELVDFGIIPTTATEWLGKYPEDYIRKHLAQIKKIVTRSNHGITSPTGYLVDAIRKGYGVYTRPTPTPAPPPNPEKCQEIARESTLDQALNNFIASKTQEELAAIERQALATASQEELDGLNATHPRYRDSSKRIIRNDYIKREMLNHE